MTLIKIILPLVCCCRRVLFSVGVQFVCAVPVSNKRFYCNLEYNLNKLIYINTLNMVHSQSSGTELKKSTVCLRGNV